MTNILTLNEYLRLSPEVCCPCQISFSGFLFKTVTETLTEQFISCQSYASKSCFTSISQIVTERIVNIIGPLCISSGAAAEH